MGAGSRGYPTPLCHEIGGIRLAEVSDARKYQTRGSIRRGEVCGEVSDARRYQARRYHRVTPYPPPGGIRCAEIYQTRGEADRVQGRMCEGGRGRRIDT